METINGHDYQENDAGTLIHWMDKCQRCQEQLAEFERLEAAAKAPTEVAK